MRLFKFLSKNKVEKDLENEFYCVLDTWMNVETTEKKGLMSIQDVKGILKSACNNARKRLKEAEATDVEAYNKYVLRFEHCFNKIEEYVNSLTHGLQV